MEASPLTQQNRPTSFEPKISQLYDDLLRRTDAEVDFADGFWQEFFLLKPDKRRLEQKLTDLSADHLLHLQHETQQLFRRAVTMVHQSKSPLDEHAFDTLTVFLRVVFSKKYTNPSSDTITVIAGLDDVDAVMSDFANAIEHGLKAGRSVDVRQKALENAIALTAGAYQTSLVSYFSHRDLFPALMKYIHDAEPDQVDFRAISLLGLLANYNKFEFRNPYKTRLEDFVNEATIFKIVSGLGLACTLSRDAYVAVQEDITETWTLGTALSYLSLGMYKSNKAPKTVPLKVEDLKEAFGNLPDPQTAILLAAFDFAAANKVFCVSFVTAEPSPPGSEAPLTAFLSLTSYILHHAYRSPRASLYGMLNILILRIIIEDLALCKLLCDPARLISVRLCRQRPPYLPTAPKPRTAAAAILDICVDTINHNLRRNLDMQLYVAVLSSIHRLLSYLTFTSTRLDFHWPLLWQTLLSFMRFTTSNATALKGQSFDIQLLVEPLVSTLAIVVLSGERFLPTTSAYDDLLYKLLEAGDWLKKFKEAFPGPIATGNPSMPTNMDISQPPKTSQNPMDVLLRINDHYHGMVEEETGKGRVGKNMSPREVNKVIKQGYESLSLPGMQGLDRWDRFREADERNLLKRAARFAVEDTRRLLQAS